MSPNKKNLIVYLLLIASSVFLVAGAVPPEEPVNERKVDKKDSREIKSQTQQLEIPVEKSVEVESEELFSKEAICSGSPTSDTQIEFYVKVQDDESPKPVELKSKVAPHGSDGKLYTTRVITLETKSPSDLKNLRVDFSIYENISFTIDSSLCPESALFLLRIYNRQAGLESVIRDVTLEVPLSAIQDYACIYSWNPPNSYMNDLTADIASSLKGLSSSNIEMIGQFCAASGSLKWLSQFEALIVLKAVYGSVVDPIDSSPPNARAYFSLLKPYSSFPASLEDFFADPSP